MEPDMNKRNRIAALVAALGFAMALPLSAQTLDTPSTTPAKGANRPVDQQGDGSQRVLDRATTTRVRAALQLDAELKTQTITVETLDGVVRLTGQVASAASSARVKDVVWPLEGVKSVDNQLVVRESAPQ
jgi:osmotically-inducible protein OsmY